MPEKPAWIPEILSSALVAAEKLTEREVRQHADSLPDPADDEISIAPVPYEHMRLLTYAHILKALSECTSDHDQSERYQRMMVLIEDLVFAELETMYGIWNDAEETCTAVRKGGMLVRYSMTDETAWDQDHDEPEPSEGADEDDAPRAPTIH